MVLRLHEREDELDAIAGALDAAADRLKAWMDAQDADPFADLPGYEGSMTLIDRESGRLLGIGFYSGAGHAHEAAAMLAKLPERAGELPEDIRPALAMQPESVGLYDVEELRVNGLGALPRS